MAHCCRQQLQGVTVVCKHGGYIATIRDALNAQQREYKRVVIHVGTNDADLSIESLEVLEDFQLLIEDAVSITDEVVVSSLCPRLDDSRANRMVDAVNAWLQGLVEGLGCIFVSHASNFYDENANIKSDLLDIDDLYLSSSGVVLDQEEF